MNNEQYWLMSKFAYEHLSKENNLKILDVGSYDVNGTHRSIFFNNAKWLYYGLDVEAGPNVDIVSVDEYNFGLDDNSFDVTISGSTAEHVRDVFAWMKEIARVTKKGGLICIITPSRIDEHRFPLDCWRIMPDGMSYLFEIANLEAISIAIDYNTSFYFTVGVARK